MKSNYFAWRSLFLIESPCPWDEHYSNYLVLLSKLTSSVETKQKKWLYCTILSHQKALKISKIKIPLQYTKIIMATPQTPKRGPSGPCLDLIHPTPMTAVLPLDLPYAHSYTVSCSLLITSLHVPKLNSTMGGHHIFFFGSLKVILFSFLLQTDGWSLPQTAVVMIKVSCFVVMRILTLLPVQR